MCCNVLAQSVSADLLLTVFQMFTMLLTLNIASITWLINELRRPEIQKCLVAKSYLRFVLNTAVVTIVSTALEHYGMVMTVSDISQSPRFYII